MKSEVFWGCTLRDRDRTRPRLGIWKPVWWVTTRQLAFWSLFSLLTFLSFEWGVFSCGIWNWNWDRRRGFLKTRAGVAFSVFGARLLNLVSFSLIQICSFFGSVRLSRLVLVLCSNWWLPCGNRVNHVHVSLLVRFGEKRKLLFRRCLPPHMACIRNRIDYGIC
jgi:hypothetical protein